MTFPDENPLGTDSKCMLVLVENVYEYVAVRGGSGNVMNCTAGADSQSRICMSI